VHKIALRSALRGLRRYYHHALDFGCGGARLMPMLVSFAEETYGVDRTPECLELAGAAKVVPDNRLLLWRDGPLPFADGFFDLLLSAYVLLRTAVLDACLPDLARVAAHRGNGILIEQLDNRRGLTPERYHETFARNGFAVLLEQTIRRSGSQWMNIASSARFPKLLTPLFARLEMTRAQRSVFGPNTQGYHDRLFVLQRS
jgi:ubiquinone/menaquinone biosynthesis C-methylase UbiE